MNTHGNNARMLRAMVENLSVLAEEYADSNNADAADQVEEAREGVAALLRLPEPAEEDDE